MFQNSYAVRSQLRVAFYGSTTKKYLSGIKKARKSIQMEIWFSLINVSTFILLYLPSTVYTIKTARHFVRKSSYPNVNT